MALAEMEGPIGAMNGVFGEASATFSGSEDAAGGDIPRGSPDAEDNDDLCEDVGTRVAGAVEGVGGPEDEGDIGSVIHIR